MNTLESLSPDDLGKTIYIRNEGQFVIDAIMRQMAHYPMHIGQIIYAAKLLKGDQWVSLSIPKGKSKDYNNDKFSRAKSKKHFTDEV